MLAQFITFNDFINDSLFVWKLLSADLNEIVRHCEEYYDILAELNLLKIDEIIFFIKKLTTFANKINTILATKKVIKWQRI